ncbi:MAG: hypothetical protein MI924_00280 [Chloroflexales bacterium]|nr:hypothetical protein [Chloroflexales bacterium]
MMTTDLAPTNGDPRAGADVMERVIVQGDLARLSPTDRGRYYMRTCKPLGLNPLTKPFEYIELNGKLTLYATRTTTDQQLAELDIQIGNSRARLARFLGLPKAAAIAMADDELRDAAIAQAARVVQDQQAEEVPAEL